MNKILTIIVPAYNMEKYLDRCLSSLLIEESLMRDFEVLVINDGSIDRTSEIAHRFELNYPNTFRTIDKENGHYGSCVNRGLQEAKGIFVKILDADDSFDKKVFPDFVRFLSDDKILNNADIILSDFSEVNVLGGIIKQQHYSVQDTFFTIEKLSATDKHEWFIHALSYRTAVLKNINYRQTEGKAYTDHEWSFIPMAHVNLMARFYGTLYCYTVGREGQSVDDTIHAKNLWMEMEILMGLTNYFKTMIATIDEDHISFLFDRLYLMVTHIYQLSLITYQYLNLSYEQLVHFDKQIEILSPNLYAATERYETRICGIIFHPVLNWRYHHNFAMTCQSLLYFIANHIAKLKK